MNCVKLPSLRDPPQVVTGEVPEWSNGLDSKSSDPLVGSVGSNPTLSASYHHN